MINQAYPSLAEAQRIWAEGLEYRKNNDGISPQIEKEYRIHSRGVASFAAILAEHVPELDANKAYILGLLHDYGKRIDESYKRNFHAREGYDAMMELGYTDVARICLTHSFPTADFKDADYGYPQDWLDWARAKLQNVVYDDYDKLVQLCDMFFEGENVVSFQNRIAGIQRRYNLKAEQLQDLYDNAENLKTYFDGKCGQDIYKLLNINEA